MERLILADGWIFKSQTGSHRHYIHPAKPGKVTIPFHSKELPESTADGKMVYSEINGETNAEPLAYGEDVSYYYCGGSDDGHAKKNKWIKLWRPEETYEEDDDNTQYWYWIDKNGEVFVPNIHDDEKAARGDKYQLEDGALVVKDEELYIVKKKNQFQGLLLQRGW